jgi:multidrug efflux pump
VLHAVQLRLRPILMTSLAFLLGVLPLVTSSGAGSAARHSLGTGVTGGTLASITFGLFFVPLFYAGAAAGAGRHDASESSDLAEVTP